MKKSIQTLLKTIGLGIFVNFGAAAQEIDEENKNRYNPLRNRANYKTMHISGAIKKFDLSQFLVPTLTAENYKMPREQKESNSLMLKLRKAKRTNYKQPAR